MKSKGTKQPAPSSFTLLNGGTPLDTSRTIAIDRGNHVARWLTALPPNVLDTGAYRRALRDLARREGWQFTFLDEAALRRRNAGAFLAVSRANQLRDAGIVHLRYRAAQRRPQRSSARRIALVGKGICFDTGGINLKSHKSMYDMHDGHAGQRRRRGHPARAQRAARSVRHRLLARDHRERDRYTRVSATGSRARCERRDDPGRAQRCRGPHGARRHARDRRAREPGADGRLRDADRRVRQRADRAVQRRFHQSVRSGTRSSERPAIAAASASGRFPWTRTTTAT